MQRIPDLNRTIYFHGTTRDRLAAIIKEGIRPDVERTWSCDRDGARGASVFFSNNMSAAWSVALEGLQKRTQRPPDSQALPIIRFLDLFVEPGLNEIVIFEISFPDDATIIRDENDREGPATYFRMVGSIPPEWFAGYWEYLGGSQWIPHFVPLREGFTDRARMQANRQRAADLKDPEELEARLKACERAGFR